jgi:hypothetical protein
MSQPATVGRYMEVRDRLLEGEHVAEDLDRRRFDLEEPDLRVCPHDELRMGELRDQGPQLIGRNPDGLDDHV